MENAKGNAGAGFTMPCKGFEKMSQMMEECVKGEGGGMDWKGVMKKFCGPNGTTGDCKEMMTHMCGCGTEKSNHP